MLPLRGGPPPPNKVDTVWDKIEELDNMKLDEVE